MTSKWESLPQWSLSPLRAALWGAVEAEEGGKWAAYEQECKVGLSALQVSGLPIPTLTVSLAGVGSVVC